MYGHKLKILCSGGPVNKISVLLLYTWMLAKPRVAANEVPSFINQDSLTSESCSCRRKLVLTLVVHTIRLKLFSIALR